MTLARRSIGVGRPAFLVAAALLLYLAVASPGEAHSTCRAKGSTTLQTSSHARVYQLDGQVYGCVFSKNIPYLLNPGPTDCEDPFDRPGPRMALAGRYVGYTLAACNIDQAKDRVYVRDLRTGKVLVQTSASETLTLGIGNRLVTDIELKANGSVAWIVMRSPSSVAEEVRKSDRTIAKGPRTTSKLLDAGNHIAPRSLTREDSTISWTNAGVTKTARLK
jgi:hypothetical protein